MCAEFIRSAVRRLIRELSDLCECAYGLSELLVSPYIVCLALFLITFECLLWHSAFLLRAVIYVEIIESTGMGNLSILFDRISWYECISCT